MILRVTPRIAAAGVLAVAAGLLATVTAAGATLEAVTPSGRHSSYESDGGGTWR